jgi:mono/diheme cytochrome c family protein
MQFNRKLTKGRGPGHRNTRFTFRLTALVVAGGMACLVSAQQEPRGTLPPGAVLEQYCAGCHNEAAKAGGLSLNAAEAATPGSSPEVWEKVLSKLRHRLMPPVGLPRPDDSTYDAVVASLVTSLDRAAAANPNPGRTPAFRRLTRTEYQNAIRDLLAVEVDVSSLLPGDESGHGFDNVTVGELSPALLERYLSAAQKISRLAVGSAVRSPGGDTIVFPPELTQERHIEGLPFGTRGGALVRYWFPLDAEYEIQIRLSRDRDERIEGLADPHEIELMLDGERVDLFTVKPVPVLTDHQHLDKHLNVRIPVKAGPRDIGVTFLRKTSALTETVRQPYEAYFNAERHPRTQPAVYSISVIGPYDATGPGETPSRRRIFACHPEQPSEEEACAERTLLTFLRRAYRRPVTDADLEIPLKFYRDARVDGGFDTGIEMALRAILVNPQFLFRMERDAPGAAPRTAYRVSDVELASRLSFFLWSSTPDDELLDLASREKLKEPAVLEKQVRRMLADRRSEVLWTNFAAQWLYLRNLASVNPDPRLFPDFDENLRQALLRETELFLESIVREDRSVLDLLRAKYTFVNERLAKHYGIPHVYGSHFRRIALGPDSARGGLLSQGSILTVTSYANRTSPVIRGKWVLTNLLGTPPAPPPAEVPPLKEITTTEKPLTMRERVAQHRANPACASCHNVMDPVGFALENYDAVGRWRTAEAGTPVDASGSLPSGASFDGAAELQQALLSRPELFVSTMVEKLLTYALGRGLEYYDAPAVRKAVREAGQDDFRFSSVIVGIVNSETFQKRMSQ